MSSGNDGMTPRATAWLAVYDAICAVDRALGATYRAVAKRALEPIALYAIGKAGEAVDWDDGDTP
jgi:hypothetical protein